MRHPSHFFYQAGSTYTQFLSGPSLVEVVELEGVFQESRFYLLEVLIELLAD